MKIARFYTRHLFRISGTNTPVAGRPGSGIFSRIFRNKSESENDDQESRHSV